MRIPFRRVGLVPLLSMLSTASWSFGSTSGAALPDTHAGRCAKAFVEAFNAGGVEAMRAFESAHRSKSALERRPVDDRIKQFEELRGNWGRIEPRSVLASEERSITLLMHTSQPGEHFEFRFVFEGSEPFGMDHIDIRGPISVDEERSALAPLTPESRANVLDDVTRAVEESYVYPEMGSKMALLIRENAKNKAYTSITAPTELADRLTEDLRGVCKDRHLTIRAEGLPEHRSGGPMRRRGTPDDARRDNYGFRQVERLPGNIGYLRFDEFHPSEEAKQVAAGAMAFLAGCDAIIFDLRNNGGGSPEMIRFLSSYFFDKPTHLNSFYDRTNNKTEEFWTLDSVPGKRFGESLPVYVLTSHYTFSGAEEFSYNLLNLKRATIVGETTGGGAHPVMRVGMAAGFSMMVPYARAENPISKTNWEGVGVKPHVEIEASQALDKAKELAAAEIEKRRQGSSGP